MAWRSSRRQRKQKSVPPEATTDRPWLLISAAFVKTGGQDRANYALASFLARRARHLHIVSHRVADEIQASGRVTVHPAPRPLTSDLLGEPFLQHMGRRWAARIGGAHVVANGGNCPWPDVNWVHYVHAAHDPVHRGGPGWRAKQQIAHRLFLRDERRALRAARLIVANSHRTARDISERMEIPPERIRVVYYGIDSGEFGPASSDERSMTRASLGWTADRPIVLFIGAMSDDRKGFDTLYRAWQRLTPATAAVDPLLVVVGRGAMVEHWQQRAAADGLARSIAFLGFRDDVPRLVRAADLLVAPTRYEAYGLGVHEALCSGLPAIVSATAGVAERYPADLADLLLPDPDDADDLAARIVMSLNADAELRLRVRPFAAALGARTWDDMADDIVRAVAA
jgi:glycosyltransferase involved in cell wall biosynthesis